MYFTDFSEWLVSGGKAAQAMFTKNARHSSTTVICSTQVLTDGKSAGGGALKNLLRNTDILTLHTSPFISADCAKITRELFPNSPRPYIYDSLLQAQIHSPAGIFEPLMIRLSSGWRLPQFRVSSNQFNAAELAMINFHMPSGIK